MMAIFNDMDDFFVEILMDDFSVFGKYFDKCLENLDRVLARCEETNIVLNNEKCHLLVKEGIILGNNESKRGLEVDCAKVKVIEKLTLQIFVKRVQSFVGHAGFYWRFIKDSLRL